MGTGAGSDNYRSTSLERGLAILACFSGQMPLLGISDIAQQLRLNRSTVHRYVSTLAVLGYLEQDRATRKYRLGLKVVDLGLAVVNRLELRQVARPHLEELSQETGQTSNMAVLDGTDIVYVERVASPFGIDLNLSVGSRLPAYCTSMGKVLLAFLDESELDRRLGGTQLLRRGPNTIVHSALLVEELRRVRADGYAVNNEELAYGLRSLAAPVRDESGRVVAAINLAVHASTHPLDELTRSLAPRLMATAAKISAFRGFRPQDRAKGGGRPMAAVDSA
jgi:IclR family pca regulon transcriptional regulator